MRDDGDAALAARASGGERRALEALLERHADRIHAVCRRIVAHPEDALDATQEAMIAVARGIDRFDGRAAFSTWCYRIATNAAIDELRRRRRRAIATDPTALPFRHGAGLPFRHGAGLPFRHGAGPEPVAVGSSTEERVAARLDVDAALREVPEKFRVAVVLRDLCDLDYAEIAEILDVPPGTVRSRISRGRAILVERLGPIGHQPRGNPEPAPERQNDDG